MSNEALRPGLLEPFLVQKIWGGYKLSSMKNIEGLAGDPLGETWEVSCHQDGPSKLHGEELNQVLESLNLPYLVKFLDTDDNLSVQVHPDDDYAREHENQLGKTECWLILDAEPGSGIYLGLKEGVTKNQLELSIKNSENVSNLMRFFPVSKGDFFFVPAGSIHAIGKGVTLVEIQQSSGVTYRVWDWNRVDQNGKGRTLHIEKALEVINFEAEKNNDLTFKIEKDLFSSLEFKNVVSHPQFEVELCPGDGHSQIFENDSSRHWAIITLDQKIKVTHGDQTQEVPPYRAYFFPMGSEIEIECNQGHYLLVK